MLTQEELIEVIDLNRSKELGASQLGGFCIEVLDKNEPRDKDAIYIRTIINPDSGEKDIIIE